MLSKIRPALAGLAVVVVVGLATPSVLGATTVALWSHSAIFDVHGPARFGLFVLVALAWVAWLCICIGLGRDVASGLRQRHNPPRTGGVRGHLAGWLLGLALFVLPGSAMGAGAVGAATAAARVSVTVPAFDETSSPASSLPLLSSLPSAPSGDRAVIPPTDVSSTAAATYTVVRGDCLSTIALRFYGDEGAWNEIWAANANRVMADGMRFSDPNLIYVGWTLVLPGLPAGSLAEADPSDPAPPLTTHPPALQPNSTSRAESPRASHQGGRGGLGAPRSPAPGDTHGAFGSRSNAASRLGQNGVSAPGEAGARRGANNETGAPAPVLGDPDGGVAVRWVPESAALGISTLVAAAYLRRIRRRRAQARAARGDGEAVADPDPTVVMLEARLAPFADAPVLEWLELANRHLTAALRAEGRPDPPPRIRVVRVGPAGVELRLDQAVDWAPGSFTLAEDGGSWWLPAGADRTLLWSVACEELAWLPLLVPVGDDAGGTYLLHLEPGDVVSLEGPDAPAMLAAWVEAAKSWPWAEQVGVARDAASAEALAPLFGGQSSLEERATVLFTGDPGVLSASTSTIVASVTSVPSRATTRVTVSAEGAFIEPFGITVRPCRIDPAAEALLAADDPCLSRVVAEDEHEEFSASTKTVGESVSRTSVELVGAGSIEVRLLTFTPQIAGLAEPLPTNMAVRITELIAWLALQGTKGTTSAAMLDHGIVGATSTKTLYNVVSAARAALGTDASGASRLIADRSTGVYRLADEVTVDVLRFMEMAERGIDSDDPHAAAELCRAALNLIDDTPVGNGSGRYGWWSSMWEARIGRLATKAAGRLAELARHGVIDLEVARTGIERARLAAEGEGELHRVVMVLEAWACNDERVEREWTEACAQAENLEPGSVPSAATENLLVAASGRRLKDEREMRQ
jgi:hypothetical protein